MMIGEIGGPQEAEAAAYVRDHMTQAGRGLYRGSVGAEGPQDGPCRRDHQRLRRKRAGEGGDPDAAGITVAPNPSAMGETMARVLSQASGRLNRPRQGAELLQPDLLGPRGRGDADRSPAAASMPGCSPFRLDRSILRRWLKAMAVTRCNIAGSAGKRGSGRAVRCTTAECTLGAGVKASGGRVITIRASQRHCASSASRP